MRDEASHAGVALQSAVSERLPALAGDGRRLKRALAQLVSNAIKFGARGGFAVFGARLGEGGLILYVSYIGDGLNPEA